MNVHRKYIGLLEFQPRLLWIVGPNAFTSDPDLVYTVEIDGDSDVVRLGQTDARALVAGNEIDRIHLERRRLVLAESDMKQVEIAAMHLEQQGRNMNGEAERVLWTGLVVTYARPFSRGNRVGRIDEGLEVSSDPTLRDLHAELCARRNDLFAHNDLTDQRGAVDVYAELGIGAGHFTETYAPPDPALLPAIQQLAAKQRSRFRERLDEIQRDLRTAG
jgi:hypothetical protein